MKKYFNLRNLALLSVSVIVYCALFFLYYQQFTSFIFFDEVANIVAGKLLLQGHQLHSEQFFNHQMLMVYISSGIQFFTQPDSLYKVILYHRVFVFLFSVALGALLIMKMRWYGLFILIIYEVTKYYLFGFLFLAEGLIVYIHMYLFYLGWRRLSDKSISFIELLLAALGTWFVVWSREPYIPLALLLFAVIVVRKKLSKNALIAVGVFFVLSLITILTVPLKEYLYQVVYLNYVTVFSDQLASNSEKNLGIFSLLFYPVFIFFSGENTFFRIFLGGLSAVFLFAFGYFIYRTRKWKLLFFTLIVLILANVRMVPPGTMYYSAFYQIQWLGLLLVGIGLVLKEVFSLKQLYATLLVVGLVVLTGFVIFQNDSYITRSVERDKLFSFQYDKYYVTANTIDTLAKPGDTLHVDFSESLLYWESKTPAKFKYIVYYPVMDDIEQYRKDRIEMFVNDPPTFYYHNCLEAKYLFTRMDTKIQYSYAPIQYPDQVNCLYILKEAGRKLTVEQLEEIKSNGYTIDPSALR